MSEPVGVVLAGGRGRRMGADKAMVELAGRPLLSYPVGAMTAALADVVVLAKPDTRLPALSGVSVWIEAEPAHHPLVGVLAALARAGGRAVMICAGDLPFVTPSVIRGLLAARETGGLAVVASSGGSVQPLLGCYAPEACELLVRAAPDAPMREVVAGLQPAVFEVPDPDVLFNVNRPEDLRRAAVMLE